jgi:ATP-binding cassette subfamily B protein
VGQLIRFRPWSYLALNITRILLFAIGFHITGLIMRAFFDTLTGNATAGRIGANLGPWVLTLLLVAVAVGRTIVSIADVTIHFTFLPTIGALVRKNLLSRILDRPGARAVPDSPGEAISRFRGDVHNSIAFTSWLPFLVSRTVFAFTAVAVMMHTDARITLIALFPLVIIVVAANLALKGIEKCRRASRKATGRVTGFIGEMFGAAQAVKVATAEPHVLTYFGNLNETRRKAALKDCLFNELLNSVFWNAINLGTSLVLLSAGEAMSATATGGSSGSASLNNSSAFTVGDLALFVFYLGFVSTFTGMVGGGWAWYRQIGVAVERMVKLLQGAPPQVLVQHGPVYVRGELPEAPYFPKTDVHQLRTLDVSGLTYRYPESGRGIEEVHLHLERRSFTVITGRVGSGKTTLLRALLGLLPKDAGEIRWNGEIVADPASFFSPPRSAYTAQAPLLFSEPLADNVLMGLPEEQVDLQAALRLAVMERDLVELEKGLDTVIGAKGVKLSGGQVQRTAAARMFVRQPELLVFDDLSSALDVETERVLWERVFEGTEAACLVVSHRKSALRHADHVIVLKDGRVEAEGQLDELLESCEEMQRLWHGDLVSAEPVGEFKHIFRCSRGLEP